MARKKRNELTPKEALFLCMEPNAKLYHGKRTFWRELHAINEELTPGCIRVEEFANPPGRDLHTKQSSAYAFHPGEKTVVIKLKTKKTAVLGAQMLNELFKGTGTHFVAEIPAGGNTPQIRSNVDKRHSSRLSVISNFYFEREITDPEERKAIHADCQRMIDAYTKGTSAEGWWKAREGVLPFVSLMGLPGNLRPPGYKKFNRKAKEKELNEPHPHGDPKIFKNVVIHVEMNHDGSIYSVLYDPLRDAYEQAQGEVKFWHFVLELLGGDAADRHISIPVRALRVGGLYFGVRGLLEGDPETIMVGAGTAAIFLADAIYNKNRIDRRLNKLRKQREKEIELGIDIENGRSAPAIAYAAEAERPVTIDHKVHKAYKGGEFHHEAEANETHLVNEARAQFLRNIINEGAKGPAPELVKAQAAHLKHTK